MGAGHLPRPHPGLLGGELSPGGSQESVISALYDPELAPSLWASVFPWVKGAGGLRDLVSAAWQVCS